MKDIKNIIIIFCTLIALVRSVQFDIELTSQQRFCFYQVFELQQKYSYQVRTTQLKSFQVQVSHIDSKQWKSVFFKTNLNTTDSIRVDKLASSSTTYSFCLRSLSAQNSTYSVLFHTGIDMLELHNLPDALDGNNLQRELNWLQKQIQALGQRSENLQGLRRINSQISNMVGTKMIILAIIGLVVIGAVNFLFFRQLKNQLKKRKLI